MWRRAGLSPDDFWHQTPLHFQLAMKGERERREDEQKAQSFMAYQAGVFSALAAKGKLKAFEYYMKPQSAQTPQEMVAMLQSMGGKSNMTIKRVRAND